MSFTKCKGRRTAGRKGWRRDGLDLKECRTLTDGLIVVTLLSLLWVVLSGVQFQIDWYYGLYCLYFYLRSVLTELCHVLGTFGSRSRSCPLTNQAVYPGVYDMVNHDDDAALVNTIDYMVYNKCKTGVLKPGSCLPTNCAYSGLHEFGIDWLCSHYTQVYYSSLWTEVWTVSSW